MATLIDSDPAIALAVVKGVFTTSFPHGIDHTRDVIFFCGNNDGAGFGKAWATADSDTTGSEYTGTCIAYASALGTGIQGNVIDVEDDIPTAYAIAKGTPWVGKPLPLSGVADAFVRWSDKNGHIPMTVTELIKDNLAGQRMMEFGDVLYQGKKLGSNFAVYGKQGIAIMIPSGLFYGVKTLRRIGIKSKAAICGNDDWHCALDREGILLELFADGNLKEHDFSNHLSSMTNKTVLSWDERKNLVNICDGSLGYIFSVKDKALGKCPVNISGMIYRGGTLYVVGPAAIANSALEDWTDIWDGGSRDDKEIMSLSFGVDSSVALYGAIKYRWDKAESFYTTPWVKADRGGVVNVSATGIEFKFGWKLASYATLRVDRFDIEVEYSELKPIMVGE